MSKGPSTTPRTQPCGTITVELEIRIDAPAEAVWHALTTQAGAWWHKDFYSHPSSRGFVIEPRVGGRLFEDGGDGAGTLWGTVIVFDPSTYVLEFAADLSPSFGGPARSIVRIELKAKGTNATEACTLTLRDAVFGRVDDGTAESLRSGWEMLFGTEGLKGYAERTARAAGR